MSPERRNSKSDAYRTIPRAAVALAAFSILATGCGSEADPKPHAAQSESHDTITLKPSHGQSSAPASHAPEQNNKPEDAAPETPHKEQQNNDQKPNPEISDSAPASTPSPELAALIFKVTGSCHMDGELDNWSKNFTPYGSTNNQITQPDGTAYEGPINNMVDGLGHSQWNIVCSDFAQEGDYAGTITDFGPDNTLGTADDRSVNYTFGISNS